MYGKFFSALPVRFPIMKLKFWEKKEGDNFHNRRNLAFFSAVFSLLIWPHELIILNLLFGLDIELIKALLIYICTLAGTTIGGYLWAAIKDDTVKNAQPPAQ